MLGRVRNEARPGVAPRATPVRGAVATYTASGAGLQLAAPKMAASFVVASSMGSKLRVRAGPARSRVRAASQRARWPRAAGSAAPACAWGRVRSALPVPRSALCSARPRGRSSCDSSSCCPSRQGPRLSRPGFARGRSSARSAPPAARPAAPDFRSRASRTCSDVNCVLQHQRAPDAARTSVRPAVPSCRSKACGAACLRSLSCARTQRCLRDTHPPPHS